MRLPSFVRGCGLLLCLTGLNATTPTSVMAQVNTNHLTHPGREVFEREFKPDNDVNTRGDGLGPLFNAKSCVGCHNQGGVGGAGDNKANVQILSIIPPKRKLTSSQQNRFRSHLNEVHPDLAATGSIILHSNSTNPEFAIWRDRILGLEFDSPVRRMTRNIRARRLEAIQRQGSVVRLPDFRGMDFLLTQRNTSSLFGTQLINSIPDEVIEEIAVAQQKAGNGIRGRVSRIPVPGQEKAAIGKFGWRGQIADLDEFVRTACTIEIGLQVAGVPQPIDPTLRSTTPVFLGVDGEPEPLPVDISDTELANLVSFVRLLPPPGERVPSERKLLNAALSGRTHFVNLNCAQCHTPRLGNVDGIFSDLLLHDMGKTLEDPLPAPGLPESTRIISGTRPGGGYYGGPVELFVDIQNPAIFRSWRTPPLWGVGDTAPYMHDGRAPTLHDAILAHDGEGLASAQNYARLGARDQEALVAFLKAIGSPLGTTRNLPDIRGVFNGTW